MEMKADLTRVLEPIAESDFFSEYWERSPLHLSRQDDKHFSDLVSLEKIEALLSYQALHFPAVQLTKHNQTIDLASYTDENRRVVPHRLVEQFLDGSTVVISKAHELFLPLADFRRHIHASTGLRCQTNVYLSPPGQQGFNAHYDSHDVFILQVSGSKTFNFYGGGIELPYAHESFRQGDHLCGPFQHSVVLEAGDTLYIPRGVMHDAVARDTPSLHITLGVYAITVMELADSMLRSLGERDMAYRRSVPRSWLTSTVSDATPDAADILAELQPVFSREQLEEALCRLADQSAIESVGSAIGMLSTRLPVIDNNPEFEAADVRSDRTALPGTELTLRSRVQLALEQIISVERHEAILRIRTHGQIVQFKDDTASALGQLLSGKEMVVSQLSLAEDSLKLEFCQRLLLSSLLRVRCE